MTGSRRRDWKVFVIFSATDDEFSRLEEQVTDAVTAALGCTNGEHECPHFQVGFSGPRNRGRRWAIRCALIDLWEAVRYGGI